MKTVSIGKAVRFFGTSLVMAAGLAGCGGGGGSSSPVSTTATIAGSVVKGPMKLAKISLYKTNADGSQGALLTETTSDANGLYRATVTDYNGIVMVVASVVAGKTVMFDEATGADITPTADFIMRASIAAEAGKTYSAQINPLTDLATANALAMPGGLSATNVAQAAKDMVETLGFDPFSTAPAFDPATNAPTNALAVVLTALSEMANTGQVGCTTGDQATKVACVTNALSTQGLDDVDMKLAVQTQTTIEADQVGLVVTITQPSGTPVTTASPLELTKAFFAVLRSNAKALDAADLSLQTELQAVSDDMSNRTV